MSHPINPDAKSLEDAFFAEQNQKLLKKIRAGEERAARREALRQVITTTDDGFLDHLLELGIGPETALALTLLPLAMVAWADGSMEAREREAILEAAGEQGIGAGTPARTLLESWLDTQPPESLIETWRSYVRSIWSQLDEGERAQMRERIVGSAREVAEASGGFLGLTSKVSAAEQQVLEALGQTLAG